MLFEREVLKIYFREFQTPFDSYNNIVTITCIWCSIHKIVLGMFEQSLTQLARQSILNWGFFFFENIINSGANLSTIYELSFNILRDRRSCRNLLILGCETIKKLLLLTSPSRIFPRKFRILQGYKLFKGVNERCSRELLGFWNFLTISVWFNYTFYSAPLRVFY